MLLSLKVSYDFFDEELTLIPLSNEKDVINTNHLQGFIQNTASNTYLMSPRNGISEILIDFPTLVK